MYFSRSAIVGAALALSAPAFAQDVTPDTVLATVNGVEITAGHLAAAKGRLPDQYRRLPDDALFSGLLDQLVQQQALGKDHTEFTTASELVLDNEIRALKAGETMQGRVDAELTEEAIEAAYQADYAGAEPEEEFSAAHILVETEDEAKALIQELEGGADFATLAREHSTGPSGPNGGDLGWFGKGQMVPEFETAVLALEAGQVSPPVQTQFGWHVVKLNETRIKDAPGLEDVRAAIVESLQQQIVDQVLADATDGSEITRVEAGSVSPTFLSDPDFLNQ